MTRFTQWIKQAITNVVDPDKPQRIALLAQTIERELGNQRQAFVLSTAVQGVEFKPTDLEEAKEIVYQTMVRRGWADGKLSHGEQSFARWAAQRLELSSAVENRININFARYYFAIAFAKAMEDGYLDATEESRLSEIAASVQMTLPDFARNFFLRESEGLLRGIFAACVSQNCLMQEDWQRLVETAAKLGVTHNELLCSIESQAKQFVEHVLADAKSDQVLSPQEEGMMYWLLGNLRLDPSFKAYVASELSRLKVITEVVNGHLPSLAPPPNVAIRSGELVHIHTPAVWRKTKVLKSGTKYEDHHGTLTLTDSRLIFSSSTRSESWNLRKIVTHSGGGEWVELQVQSQAASLFFFPHHDELNYLIFSSTVAMANQTLVRKGDAPNTRHIPREVRQRVWQRYGGRCAECNAEDYLEFDHIVPVAKGGSNSDMNVQLLCRKCNLKKSDHI